MPCPGVALRLHAVIDCTPSAARMPPFTIDFLKKNLPAPPRWACARAAATKQVVVTGRFTGDAGDFVLINQIRRVEQMVATAGLPAACAPSVNDFLQFSAATAANSFYKSVAVTVEADDPDSIFASGGDLPEDECEGGVCAICYEEYLVGGAASAAVRQLACGHEFHRECIDRWTAVNRSCPCCRAPVPEGGELPSWDVVTGSYQNL
ncbi:unnamed protein product [Urochloa humidicola]